jgi:hypothetical protein
LALGAKLFYGLAEPLQVLAAVPQARAEHFCPLAEQIFYRARLHQGVAEEIGSLAAVSWGVAE